MPEITNRLCRRAHSVVISGHVTRHVVDFSNYADFSVLAGEYVFNYIVSDGRTRASCHHEIYIITGTKVLYVIVNIMEDGLQLLKSSFN